MANSNAISLILLLIVLAGCNSQPAQKIKGEAQGTTYSIILPDGEAIAKTSVDSLLRQFDLSLSTYVPNSTVSQLNASESGIWLSDTDSFFVPMMQISDEMVRKTNGYFDPTVFPLVSAWGFFKPKVLSPTSAQIDSILQFVGWEKQLFSYTSKTKYIAKKDYRAALDFNAIAQGYAVDCLAAFLEKRGVKNYFVELGGELRLKGKNESGEDWKIGIDKPQDHSDGGNRQILSVLEITNVGLATSGNYRKFQILNGRKIVHTLNPKNGYGKANDLLSATVLAPSAAEADALATAFMAMGYAATQNWLKHHPEIKVVLVYSDEKNRTKTYVSSGLQLNSET